MTQYLVAIHHPGDYDPSTEDEAMARDIDTLNDELVQLVSGFSLARVATCRHRLTITKDIWDSSGLEFTPKKTITCLDTHMRFGVYQ